MLNTSFHMDLRKFVGDWTWIIQRLEYNFLKLTTMSIWIIF
jgi:hypothetical protein